MEQLKKDQSKNEKTDSDRTYPCVTLNLHLLLIQIHQRNNSLEILLVNQLKFGIEKIRIITKSLLHTNSEQ